MSVFLGMWDILEVANAADVRRRRIAERRRARRLLRDNTDPLFEMTEVEFVKTYRLTKDAVRELACDVLPLLPRERRRDGMSGMLKVLIALCFYASGSYQTLVGQSAHHNVSQMSVCRAVRQVTKALNDPNVHRKYVRWPMVPDERNQIKTGFYQKFGIPGVLGCIDGTHVAIIRPQQHEERYLCRKGYHSLNVMIICDSNLRILCVDASSLGSAHDSMVWGSHPLSIHMTELHGNGDHAFLLGDSGYPLRNTMMTPILDTVEGTPEHHYYEMHVRARNTVERCIGVLKARFRCLLLARTLHYSPVRAGQIINACTVLHNIAISTNTPEIQLTPEELQHENQMRNNIEQNISESAAETAEAGRASGGRASRVNPALLEGRAVQQALVEKLWRDRNVH